MNASQAQTGQKRIENLTLREVDRIYSLARVGEWTELEIGKRYKISREDVRKVIDNYEELREMRERNQHNEQLPQEPSPELTKKPRKRRSDAIYATAKERQAAYRARLREKRPTAIEQPSLAGDTDTVVPTHEQFSVTGCQDPVTETSPEDADPQSSTCYSSSLESDDVR